MIIQKIEEKGGKEYKTEDIQIVMAIEMMGNLVLEMFEVKSLKIQELMVDKVITATTDLIEQKISMVKATMEVLIEIQF
jgi:H2-forming N5,N10-methylenetetrahydromethanopterin dehydrogenase-like enzyme